MNTSYYSNGKLLITGEYLVLDGAISLAVPTKYGQSLTLSPIPEKQLVWKSLDEKGKIWFSDTYDLETFNTAVAPTSSAGDPEKQAISHTLWSLLREAKRLNPHFLEGAQGYEAVTSLNFPRDWGLGSSSTLINNIAQWAGVDAYALLWNAFTGSGYDIACAQHHTPITYQLKAGRPLVTPCTFNPPFKNELYFIHLNQKQNSREGIADYRSKPRNIQNALAPISHITARMLTSTRLDQFKKLVHKHETILSNLLEVAPVQERLFPDYKGAIKSLGAWGGDFILATGTKNTPFYFAEKGYTTIIPYAKMVR